MAQAPRSGRPKSAPAKRTWRDARRVLVLQGGGALGSYQAGVYQALSSEVAELDWVVGISIGAVNAALIVGNAPEDRTARLQEFWDLATSQTLPQPLFRSGEGRFVYNEVSAANVALFGAPGFFAPRFPPPFLAPEGSIAALSLYDTEPLRRTLERLVDFDRINHPSAMRLTVGAVDVETGNSVLFDSRRERLGPEHVLASGALPPGLPPVEIEGRLYWDGGIVSNTPLQFVLDDDEDVDTLVFQVDLFSAVGPRPRALRDVTEREKDIRYSSRTRFNTDMLKAQHHVKSAARSLLKDLPPEFRERADYKVLKALAREASVCVVQLIYRKQPYEGGSKDFEFSRQSMLEHWSSGRADIVNHAPLLRELMDRPPHPGMTVVDPGEAARHPSEHPLERPE